MDSVTIEWLPSRYDEIDDHEDAYLYAISQRNKLLYIGKAYKQSVQARVQHVDHIRKKYGNILEKVVCWLGDFNYQSFTRISPQRVADVENLLIYMNQPADNVPYKKSYTGRDNLIVRSTGCNLLLPEIKVGNGLCYPASQRPY